MKLLSHGLVEIYVMSQFCSFKTVVLVQSDNHDFFVLNKTNAIHPASAFSAVPTYSQKKSLPTLNVTRRLKDRSQLTGDNMQKILH